MNRLLIISFIFVATAAVTVFAVGCNPFAKPTYEYNCFNVDSVSKNYADVFNDVQAVQIVAARKFGISPVEEKDIQGKHPVKCVP